MCIHNLVSISLFVLKILNKNRILTSVKGCNFVAKLRKTTFYNPKVDIVYDNVYTKFVSVSLFVLKILKKNLILTSNKGHNSVVKLWRIPIYDLNVDLIYDNM